MDFQLVADTHTHALASGHAYSTLLENLHAAKAIGLSFLCYTEHGPAMEDAPRRFYFHNIKNLPDMVEGVGLLKGAEANICDYEGTLHLPEKDLAALDWVIASYHTQVIDPSTKEDATRGWLAVAKNPLVDVLGHCGDSHYDFDQEMVVKACKEHGKIIEINSHSFEVRQGSKENCRSIALLCKEYRVPVVVSSDAHFVTSIGKVGNSLALLEEIGFPPELILNGEYNRFLQVVREKTGRFQ